MLIEMFIECDAYGCASLLKMMIIKMYANGNVCSLKWMLIEKDMRLY